MLSAATRSVVAWNESAVRAPGGVYRGSRPRLLFVVESLRSRSLRLQWILSKSLSTNAPLYGTQSRNSVRLSTLYAV